MSEFRSGTKVEDKAELGSPSYEADTLFISVPMTAAFVEIYKLIRTKQGEGVG